MDEHDLAHKHLVAENCVNAQFCVNDYKKLRPKLRQALILCNRSHNAMAEPDLK